MIATVELSEAELAELREFTHAADANAVVRSSLTEYRGYARRMRRKELSAQVAMNGNWRALEAAEPPNSRAESDSRSVAADLN